MLDPELFEISVLGYIEGIKCFALDRVLFGKTVLGYMEGL